MKPHIGFIPLYQIHQPSSRYRVFQFLPILAQAGYSMTVLEAPERRVEKRLTYLPRLFHLATHCDVLFVQKRMFPLWVLRLLLALNSRMVFDFDDAVFLRPSLKPKIDYMIRSAKVVIVGNNNLAEYARQLNEHVVVIPSVVDTHLYKPAEIKSKNGQVTLGWIGSDPNRGDFEGMEPLLDWIGNNYPGRVTFQIIAARTLAVTTSLPIEWCPWSLSSSRQALQQIDIGIMPLPDTEWNRGKCGFKLIQYMAVGAPVVAAPVGANKQIIVHGESGFLADSIEMWQNYLSQLIENEEMRFHMGKSARDRVVAHYSVDAVSRQLQQVLLQVSS